MSDLLNLLSLLVFGAVVGLWLKLSRARERATHEARQLCGRYGLQLLDETVGLRGLRVRRVNGVRRLERCYGFEVSIDGDDRQPGRLWMIGDALSSLSLPTVASLPAGAEATDAPATAALGRVLPFRPRPDNRLH
ncbi:MAG: DUF3301 domain-containing protein [Pseudomonadota bacterium]|nr:DUF3301 domain-containing protein [Xanthomonadaceae bacterium]MDE2247049.1 DUF3301 domain-containing protein [Xanthomonadaceae bacterium]MDE3209435.1 DUF3301 domain-containing protein [Pseudomonadota bacterium]